MDSLMPKQGSRNPRGVGSLPALPCQPLPSALQSSPLHLEVLSALSSKCSLAWPRLPHHHLTHALASYEAPLSPQGTARSFHVSSLPSASVQPPPLPSF